MSIQNNKWYCKRCVGIVCNKHCVIGAKEINWIECEQCDEWFHQLCVAITDKKYTKLNSTNEKWYCFGCSNERLEQ